MSIVRYDPILPGDPRSATALNQILSDLSDGSANLDARNFAEEGMDGRAVEVHPVGYRTGKITVTTRNAATLATSPTFVPLVHNVTTLRLSSPANVPAALLANERLRFRTRIWFETTIAAGYGIDGEFEIQLAHDAGAGAIRIPFTGRKAFCNDWHATVFSEGWVQGPVNITSVEVQYKLRVYPGAGVGGVAFPSCSCTWATLFKRCTDF